jgi:hypothetical protein
MSIFYEIQGKKKLMLVLEGFFPLPPQPDQLWGPPTSYPMDTRGSFSRSKVAGA